jgi:HEAT repeat protein
MENDLQTRLEAWLARLNAPGLKIRDVNTIVAEMGERGDRVFPLLVPLLNRPEPQVRSTACAALLSMDAHRSVEFVLPLLVDPDVGVRCDVCGCLHRFGDERAIDPLIRVLQSDSDAQVRGTAAYALGGIGSPAAIPALLSAMESDHELDILGHSASSCAATALDDILGTDETRIKVSETLRKMRPGKPDLDRLKRLAQQRYHEG